jgi:O-methyltransferase
MFGKINSFVKDIVLASRIAYLIYPFRKFLLFLSNLAELTAWIQRNKHNTQQNDFYVVKRNYAERLNGFKFIVNNYQLEQTPVTYLEFGVASGDSFEWWLNHLKHPESVFFGFDTFEGLPENWGLFFKKGAMAHDMKEIADTRHTFFKGIFQDTLVDAINKNRDLLERKSRKIIHLDADLFSSTIFVLSQLYPFLQPGDVLIFDEFNVPNHEFYAVKIFQESFYVKLKPVSALNNFYQTIFIVEA